jgi:glycine/D-amino acid oxidase-like deaminating enzyme
MKELADDSDDAFAMKYSGYDFISESIGREIFPATHLDDPDNATNLVRITGSEEIQAIQPCLGDSIQQLVRIKNAGAIDVHAMGSLLLARARKAGVEFIQASIEDMTRGPSRFTLNLSDNGSNFQLETDKLLLTPGPFINELAAMLGLSIPVESILQRKFVIPDPLKLIPRDMPFSIFADPQHLNWSEEDRSLIGESPEYSWLLDEFPAGLHIKPEGAGNIKLGWAYNRKAEAPQWQSPDDIDFPNVTLRGASRFIPTLSAYVEQTPTPVVQFSGYYTRTPENLPLIGPLPCEGLYTVSALAGFGTMAACSAGELCAATMTGEELPSYAPYFHPGRYEDRDLMAEINQVNSDGQL